MEEMERRYATRPLRAETGIGGSTVARAFVEQVDLGQGQVSKRAMIGIKLPFWGMRAAVPPASVFLPVAFCRHRAWQGRRMIRGTAA
jgi:hypothetical protein